MIDLFASAGLDLPRSGKGESRAHKIAHRSPRAPLFAHKVVEDAIGRSAFAPDDGLVVAAREYARKVRGLPAAKEKTFRPVFIDNVLIKILGYSRIDPDRPYTLADEHTLGTGSVDTALGHFEVAGGVKKVVAPFELKGPDTNDLDQIMPGRGTKPVQQAWDYAIDAPGLEMGAGVELRRSQALRFRARPRGIRSLRSSSDWMSRRNVTAVAHPCGGLLGDATDKLLRDTDAAYDDITDELYLDYKDLRERLMSYLVGFADGPKLASLAAVEAAQKILDRILFIAFAQRTDLLPDRLLDSALKAVNEFVPQPVWLNFLGAVPPGGQGQGRHRNTGLQRRPLRKIPSPTA